MVGLPHSRWIEAVTAVIVTKQGQSLSEKEVVEFCGKRLGGFKVPKGVVLSMRCRRTRAASFSSANCASCSRRTTMFFRRRQKDQRPRSPSAMG